MCCLVREEQGEDTARRRVEQKAEQPTQQRSQTLVLVLFILLFSLFICLSCAPSHSCKGNARLQPQRPERKKIRAKERDRKTSLKKAREKHRCVSNRVVLKQGETGNRINPKTNRTFST